MTSAESLVLLVQLWGCVGAFVAVLFLTIGVSQIDEDARGALAFRPLLVPGVLVLWPLVLWRWWALATGRDRWRARHSPPRSVYAPFTVIFAVLVAATLLTSFMVRQSWPDHIAPVQLQDGVTE